MGLHRRTLLHAGSVAALAGLGGGVARAALPQGLVYILVGFPPGGGTDVMDRVIAERLRRRGDLKNIVIENRVGASGTLACEALRHVAPDGTTVLFAPITLTGAVQTAFAVAPGLPVRDFEEYAAWLKADQRRGSFGSTALGSTTHFFGLILGSAFGIRLQPVGYCGTAPLISDLGAGHIAAGCRGERLTPNRPEKRNAPNNARRGAVSGALTRADGDSGRRRRTAAGSVVWRCPAIGGRDRGGCLQTSPQRLDDPAGKAGRGRIR